MLIRYDRKKYAIQQFWLHFTVMLQLQVYLKITWQYFIHLLNFSSIDQWCLTLCDPHGLQHARLPCPSPTPGAYSNLCPSSWWCHPTIWQRNQRSNCQHPLDRQKSREFQKNISFCFTDYAKALYCVDHNKLWKILKEMGIPDHWTCLFRNLYADQEATAITRHGTTDWFQIRKGVCQGCI